jgi:hypothetical protein
VYGALDRPNLNQPEKAAPLYEQAVRILERVAPLDAQDRQTRFDLAARYGKLGDAVWSSNPQRSLELYERAVKTAEALVSKEYIATIRTAYLKSISRPLIALGRTAEARRALSEVVKGEHSQAYADRLTGIEVDMLWAELLRKEGKQAEAEQTLEAAIKSASELRSGHANDLSGIYYLSGCYRELAAITTGERRKNALLGSASAWHSWPATSFTKREEQRDLAAAGSR